MHDDIEAQVDRIFEGKRDVFCGTCRFYAPWREQRRCLHPNALHAAKTFAGITVVYDEPEDRNKDNTCRDYHAKPGMHEPAAFISTMLIFALPALVVVWLLFQVLQGK